jgi:hypothetical protein
MLPTLVTALGAVRPEPGQARSWVERELSRPEYQRSLLDRFMSWLSDLWEGLTHAAGGASSWSAGIAVVLLVVVVALLVAVAGRVRREPSAARAAGPGLIVGEVSPEDHRAASERALSEGRFAEALVEAFRALASRSLRRGLVEARPGLTAHELATDLSSAFPQQAGALHHSAVLFDAVFYGEQDAEPGDVRSVLDLDETLRTSRVVGRTHAAEPPVSGVPR